jgi:hypothetical protein
MAAAGEEVEELLADAQGPVFVVFGYGLTRYLSPVGEFQLGRPPRWSPPR